MSKITHQIPCSCFLELITSSLNRKLFPIFPQVYLFSPAFVYSYFNNTGIALIQLMAYISSCCNPITYCFMNRRFRGAFTAIVRSYKCWYVFCLCLPLTIKKELLYTYFRHLSLYSSCLNNSSEGAESQMFSLKHRGNIVQVPCNSDASNNSNSYVGGGRNNTAQRSGKLVLIVQHVTTYFNVLIILNAQS